MVLIKNQNVYFEPVSHSYINQEGKLLIGLTSLMAKHNLGADYSGIPDSVLKIAAEKGTRIHKYLQDYDEGKMVPMSDLLEAYKKLNYHHLASEYLVSDNVIVATSIDKVYEVDENLVDIADVKTTQKVHRRALEWQLGVGKVLFERQNPGVKVRNTFCIWIDKSKEQLRDIIPITPVPESYVDDLLKAERKGEAYSDPYTAESAVTVLTDDLARYSANISLMAELKAKLKETEAFVKECDKKLVAYMTENNLEEMLVEGGTVKLKKGYQRKAVDTARLAKDYPQLAAKYEKVSDVSPSIIYKSNN